MSRTAYYQALKALARSIRQAHGLTTPKVMLRDMHRIYKSYGLKVVLWKGPLKKIRGAYTNDEFGAEVMVSAKLPKETRIITMGHELKHHVADMPGPSYIEPPDDVTKEKGAEVFAVELIYPEEEFAQHFARLGITAGNFTKEDIVRLKRTSETTLSFTALAKRAEFLGLAPKDSLSKVKWLILQTEMFGEADYIRIQRYKAKKKAG